MNNKRVVNLISVVLNLVLIFPLMFKFIYWVIFAGIIPNYNRDHLQSEGTSFSEIYIESDFYLFVIENINSFNLTLIISLLIAFLFGQFISSLLLRLLLNFIKK